MVGPVLDNEDGRLMGESHASSITGDISDAPVAYRRSLAHGILCPETVTKMKTAAMGGRSNRVVKTFIDRYHKHGPMSCMELLSDPEILPHLTAAMRDLA